MLLRCFLCAVTKGITLLRIYNLLLLCTRWGQAPITAQRRVIPTQGSASLGEGGLKATALVVWGC